MGDKISSKSKDSVWPTRNAESEEKISEIPMEGDIAPATKQHVVDERRLIYSISNMEYRKIITFKRMQLINHLNLGQKLIGNK